MFKTWIAPSKLTDRKLFQYVQDTFIGIIEIEAMDYLNSWNKTDPLEEYLDSIFPRAFIRRNPQKALQIIYDLDDIARSDIVRETLPPLHTYAMYQMIRNYEDLKEDIGPTEYDNEIEDYLHKKYKGERFDSYLFWFSDLSEDFVAQYDDEYIWFDIWEYHFSWYINHPEDFWGSTLEMEEMLELMPNDIIYQWNKLKKDIRGLVHEKPNLYTAISHFKEFVEGNVYPAFHVTKKPREETGRSLLQTYLSPRGFREAQMSGGKSDLVYPIEEAIIETKIWRDQERFQDGIVELSSYLDSQGYNIGYYVVFDNTQKNNAIVSLHGTDIFNVHHENHLIYCFFIKIKPVAPSRRRKFKETDPKTPIALNNKDTLEGSA